MSGWVWDREVSGFIANCHSLALYTYSLYANLFAKYTDMEHSINMYNVVIIAFYYVHTNRMETNDIHRQNQIDNS